MKYNVLKRSIVSLLLCGVSALSADALVVKETQLSLKDVPAFSENYVDNFIVTEKPLQIDYRKVAQNTPARGKQGHHQRIPPPPPGHNAGAAGQRHIPAVLPRGARNNAGATGQRQTPAVLPGPARNNAGAAGQRQIPAVLPGRARNNAGAVRGANRRLPPANPGTGLNPQNGGNNARRQRHSRHHQVIPRFKGGKLNTDRNAAKVFDAPVVEPFRTSGLPVKTGIANGANPRAARLNWARKTFGKFLGGGANSSAFLDKTDSSKVYKVVKLKGPNDRSGATQATITDQQAGEAMLKQIKTAIEGTGKKTRHALFSVAESGQPEIYELRDGSGANVQTVVVTKSDNIASYVFDANGKRIKNFNKRTGKQDGWKTATNAFERARIREQAAGKIVRSDVAPKLNPQEELTISLVVRRLNNKGIVWADHKLQNLDIVRDPKSPTGYRVIFFDFDAFRPVKGPNSSARRINARKIQKQFDQAQADPQVDVGRQFDMSVFGPENVVGYMYSPKANNGRSASLLDKTPGYHDFNNMSDEQLKAAGEKMLSRRRNITRRRVEVEPSLFEE